MKKTLCCLMALLMIFALCAPAAVAEPSPTVAVGSAIGNPGDTVQVPVTIRDNPGLIAMRLNVQYDASRLVLVDAQDQGIFGTGNASFGKDKTANPYTLLWEDAQAEENYTADGTLALLTFRILDDAQAGNAAVTVTLDEGSTFNIDVEGVTLQLTDGKVTVLESGTPVPPTPKITVSGAQVQAGETVDIAVSIQNNPGIIGLLLNVQYDTTKLQLLDAVDQGTLGSGTASFGRDKSLVPYTLSWSEALATENYTGNGTLAILTFKALNSAASGDTVITLTLDQGSTINVDMEPVVFTLESGIVSIEGAQVPPAGSPIITCGDAQVKAGETVNVPIYMQNNPGLVALKLNVSYDSDILTLVGVEDGGLFGSGNAYFGNRLTDIPYSLLWEDGLAQSNYQGNGLLVTLTFEAAQNASTCEADVTLALEQGSTFDIDMNEIAFTLEDGTVSVSEFVDPSTLHPTISVGTASGKAGDTVQVPVTIADNPGLIALKLDVSYDSSILTLVDVEDGGLFGVGNTFFGNDLGLNPYTLMWWDALSENYTDNGTLAVLTFTLAGDAAEGETTITLDYDPGSAFNTDFEEVAFTLEDGSVTVLPDTHGTTVTVTYDAQSGTADATDKEVTVGSAYGELAGASREGFTFDGWFTSAEGGTRIDADTIVTQTENHTIFAHWTINTYTVTVTTNGHGTASSDPAGTAAFNASVTLTAAADAGYTFAGWESSDVAITGDTFVMPAKNVAVTAAFTANSYSIAFDANGGTNTMAAIAAHYDESVELPACTFERSGFSFLGWALTDNAEGIDYADGASVRNLTVTANATVTLYAVWEADAVQIELVAAEGSTAVVDNELGFIYGLNYEVTEDDLNDLYLTVNGDGHFEVETPTGLIGTGTVVNLINNTTNVVEASYQIVIFGDINGDGMLNAADVAMIRSLNARLTTLEEDSAQFYAADVVRDEMINAADLARFRSANARLTELSQTL